MELKSFRLNQTCSFPWPRSGRSAESAKHTSPGQAAPKARAALGSAPYWSVFLSLFGFSRRS